MGHSMRKVLYSIIICFLFKGYSYAQSITESNPVINDGVCDYIIEGNDYEQWGVCKRLTNYGLLILELPDSIQHEGQWYPVRAIADTAFMNSSARKIILPQTVKEIGDYSFLSCLNIREIYLPDSVKTIGKGAFRYCYRLEDINLPPGLKRIEPETFFCCLSLKKIPIPDGVEFIGFESFFACGLEEIHIPSTVTQIGNYGVNRDVFLGCSSLVKITVDANNEIFDSRNHCNAIIETSSNTLISGCGTTVIPRTIKKIGVCSFAFRGNLKKIVIPSGVNYIASLAFAGCDNLNTIKVSKRNHMYDSRSNCNAIIYSERGRLHTACKNTVIPSDINVIDDYAYVGLSIDYFLIPDNIEVIGAYAFWGCQRLQYLSLPDGLKSIGHSAFEACTALRKIDIPQSVKSIYSNTFKDCYSLNSIGLPSSAIEIADDAFDGCHNLKIETVNYTQK
jgi:hypothetical protein